MIALAPSGKQLKRAFPLLSAETVAEVSTRGLLSLPGNELWRLGDINNGTTRRLDQKRFVRSDNKGADWHKLIGLLDVIERDRRFVIFILEGSKDAVAALELAHRAGLICRVGIVAAQGAGYRPIQSELEQLRGRKVLLIGDRDNAGMEAVRRVSNALTQAHVDHAIWNWNAFDSCDGKDLFDWLKATNCKKKFSYEPLFLFFSPSNGSTVQQFNRFNSSTNVLNGGFNSSTNILELVERFVVRRRGTGNTQSFALARALRAYEEASNTSLTETKIDEIFHQWFTKSQPLLPPDADEEKSCAHFYSQMRRVRYLRCALDAALERARTLPLPDIPGLSTNALKVAALMRELQRDAGDKFFICPVNVVTRFASLRFPEQAKRVLLALEKAAVVRCEERGAPHIPGKPGKSTIWRYNLAVEPTIFRAARVVGLTSETQSTRTNQTIGETKTC